MPILSASARALSDVHASRRTRVSDLDRIGPPRRARLLCASTTSSRNVHARQAGRSISRSASRSIRCPPFVGPVLQQHIAEFGRYPANKGNENFRRAVGAMAVAALRAAARARSRTRNHRAQRHARGPVPRRHRRAALCRSAAKANLRSSFPIRSTRPMPPAPTPPTANPFICPRPPTTAFFPISTRCPTICSRARCVFYLASPSNPQGAVADGAYLARLVVTRAAFRFPDLRRRMLFGNLFHAEAGRHARTCGPGLRQCRDLPFALQALEPAGPARRLCRRRHAISCRASSNCATCRRRRCRFPRRKSRSPLMPTRRMSQENRRLYSAKFDLADQIIGGRYGYKRPAGGFFLWLDISAYGGSDEVTLKLWREAGLRVLPGGYAARIARRRIQSRREIYPHRHGAGPRDHGGGAAPPRRRAGVRASWRRSITAISTRSISSPTISAAWSAAASRN